MMSLPIFVSRNGELIAPADACVSIFNPALYGSYGVYESLQVVHGAPFAEGAHLERLAHSAAMIRLPLPGDLSMFQLWTSQVLEANEAVDCTLRIFVLGPENGGEVAAYLWPQPAPVYPPEFYTQGASAITVEGQRALPTAKTLNTLVSYLAQRQAQAAGVHEGLLYHAGDLTEGASSNLFAVIEDSILTPPDGEVLPGVARDITLYLATREGLPLRQAPLPIASLASWSECFITSSSRHVMPITTIDGRPVGDGQVGPNTRRLMALFEDYFLKATSE